MRAITLTGETDTAGFYAAAAALAQQDVSARDVEWRTLARERDLFAAQDASLAPQRAADADRPPRAFIAATRVMLLHRDPARFALAYRLLHRLKREPNLLQIASDPDVARAGAMAKAVRRDVHKMKAFVRFRALRFSDDTEFFVSWFEPEHHVVAAVAPHFVDRFANMRWSILTPRASAHWDGAALRLAGGATRADAPGDDALEALWRTYFAHIFNPARLNVKAMQLQMPKKYWANLPEAAIIAPLVAGAPARARAMLAAAPRLVAARHACGDPGDRTGGALQGCRRCPLWRDATQAVAGEGPLDAALMIVGEQPGDREDIAGKPFVGPAGRLLDEALARAGVERAKAYVTNAVKHFKFEPRGKQRLHKTPAAAEIDACRHWLDGERALVKPKLILALGASALRGLGLRSASISSLRGSAHALPDATLIATVHPSYLLRLRDEDEKREQWRAFLADLRKAQEALQEL
ncbi:MAG: UdgX family uracil-DNA binding protein [Hyphomicrobiales bacterium]|nr:UdgX family uracil-DNA binding protein [Hyphomicrobiales bacterium]